MTTLRLRVPLAAVLLVGLSVSPAIAADQQKEPPAGLDQAAIEKMMAEFAEPGPEHEDFKALVGVWNTKTESYWGNPKEPEVSEGTATFKLILGGRFVLQKFKSVAGGKPFEGIGISGYDKAKKKHVTVWLDNTCTSIMTGEGEYDADTKTFTEAGEVSSPFGTMRYRNEIKESSDDEFTLTMYMTTPDGKETKAMVVTYTRKK
jgi:hypothetical protein